MKCLITGGAGFIGSELGKFLLSKGHEVILLDNLEYGYKDNFEDVPELSKNFVLEDIRSNGFNKHLKGVDVVYHFAGISSLPECESNPSKAYEVNTAGTANILSAVRESNVRRVIFASTSAVYENSTTPNVKHKEDEKVSPNLVYSTSKYCAEQICRSYSENYGMDIIICRFFNVFGPHQDFKRKYPPFTSYLIREIVNNRTPVIYNTAPVKRDYIYVDDLMEYLFRMGKSTSTYRADIFNLASGAAVSTLEILATVYDLLGRVKEYKEGDPLKFWDKYSELFNKTFNLDRDRVKREVFKNCLGDPQKVRNEFNYIPKRTLRDGMMEIVNFQRKYSEK